MIFLSCTALNFVVLAPYTFFLIIHSFFLAEDGGCTGPTQYCDCGTGMCKCAAGYSGPDCTHDVCASARCGPHGVCAARFTFFLTLYKFICYLLWLERYLGGDLETVRDSCVCVAPFVGPTCESNPCLDISCNNRGTCFPQVF